MSIKVIGITGGIGSGKTTVARIFAAMGYAIYYADERSRHLLHHDPQVRQAVTALLGANAYREDGSPDRGFIGKAVFGHGETLKALNAIMHPAVQQDRLHWLDMLKAEGYSKPFALTEAAILFESGAHRQMQGVITVTAPEAQRITRVMARDSATEEQVRARMGHQLSEEERVARADFVIHNDGLQPLIPQVLKAIRHFS